MMKCLPWYLHERARSRTTYAASFITMPLAAASSECFIFQLVPPPPPSNNGWRTETPSKVASIV